MVLVPRHRCRTGRTVGGALVAFGLGAGSLDAQPRFTAHEVATGLRGGYQTLAVDLNRDRRPDLLAVASGLSELVWFENPRWTRRVLAGGFSGLINVAAIDLDGDGIPEIAVAYGFSTRPERSEGIVSLLKRGSDPGAPWSRKDIDFTPTAHRLRWFSATGGERWLVNAPLAGAASRQPDYIGPTPIYLYRPPAWQRELISGAEQGVVHAAEPVRWSDTTGTSLLVAGFMGVHEYRLTDGRWTRSRLAPGNPAPAPRGGASEIALGSLGDERFFATLEPWHGNQVVVYRRRGGDWQRSVIDSTITDGHTLVVADFDGDRRDELVVGQRGGARSVMLYTADGSGRWSASPIDAGGMAGAGCVAADINRDGRIDVACIGSATANLKWYENAGPARSPTPTPADVPRPWRRNQ